VGSDDTLYYARFLYPTMVERGRSNLIKCAVYRSGLLAAPSAGTVTLYNEDGSPVVDGAAVTVSGSVAQYTIPAGTIAGLTLGDGWIVEWSLTMPDGVVHTYRNEAALVRRALYPVVTDADLYRRVSSLDPSGNTPLSSATTYQEHRDEAWTAIQNRLIAAGNRPNLVTSPTALREAHLLLTLALIFEDFATRLNDAYEGRADAYRRQYDQEFRRVQLKYDTDDDGTPDFGGRRSAVPTVWLGSGRWRR